MKMRSDLVLRSATAEFVRTKGRSRLWMVAAPVAVGVPLAVSFLIAAVAERFARIPGQLSILQVATSNAAYWVISITVVVIAVAAADGQASERRHQSGDHIRLAIPSRWADLLGKWLFYGVIGLVLALATIVVVLTALPVISQTVYGTVSPTDATARRLLWTVPLYAFFAAGAGVGIGALIRSPVAAVGAILFWAYVIESAAGYLPSGASVQQYLPVLNAIYGTGQDIALFPPWNHDVALLYTCVVFTAIFAIATIEGKVRK